MIYNRSHSPSRCVMRFLSRGNKFSHSEIFLDLKNPALINSDESILGRMMKSFVASRYKCIMSNYFCIENNNSYSHFSTGNIFDILKVTLIILPLTFLSLSNSTVYSPLL